MRTTSRKPASNSKKAAAAAAEAAAAAAPAAPDSGASDDGTAGAGGSNTSSASGEAAAGAEAPPSKLCRRKAAEAAEDGGDVAAAAPPAAKKARRKTKAELAEEVRQGVSRGDLPPHVVLHERFPHSRDYAAGAVPLPAAALEVAQRRNDEISAAAVAAAAAAALAAAASSAAATQAAMAASGGAGAVQALQVAVAEAGALGVLAAMSNTAAAGSAGAYAGGAATSGSDEGPGSAGASEREGSAGTAAAQELAAKEEEEEQQCGRKRRGRAAKPKGKKAAAAAAAAAAGGEVEGQEQVAAGGEEAAEAGPAGPAPPPVRPMPDHIPNLGYACLCATMREHDVYASRDTNKAGFTGKGLPHVSRLALANARDLLPLLRWNEAHGIRLFRLSSGIFPWMSFYELEELPDAEGIKQALAEVGEVAKQLGHRLTFHPSEFTKIASDKPEVVETSVKELEVHSRIFDLMGFLPASVYNKINIHVGGVYGDKVASMDRFAKVVLERLSPNCRARLTVENDDRASMYSVADLTYLAAKAHIPIVFDFHHHRFCTGGLTEEQAFRTALATWPPGVRPVVHWSESQAGRRPHAHSDYVSGPIYLYGMEKEVDVMIESKAKELALLHYRQAALQGLAAARPEDQQEPEEDEEGTK
ncbi:hypothetical protein HYH02_004112 [Chlamydomonas schloesseri]|uniref:Uncharacterized protein n=1 Tax=Chlamydomonas schloesseri TaxID=2026947 RepID=A0A835WP91_9CHLO|nr:hypothetical protein HYH02_004112 [Chlamydomonas schloesseri]|eukprot:KAG2451514.1 hypothetical protein HYH02_004112 [Chlamydomonas schloesseri]